MLSLSNEFTFGAVIIAGLLAGFSPCTLPTAALVVGFVSGCRETTRLRSFYLTLSFVLGLSLTLAVLGVLAAGLGTFILHLSYIYKVLGILMIFLGLVMLKVIPLSSFVPEGALSIFEAGRGGILGAFVLGIPFALVASPCTVPITVAILALAVTKADLLFGFVLLLFYALGRSIPLLIVGTFTGFLKSIMNKQCFLVSLQKFGGIILIGLGAYFTLFAK